MFVKKASGTVQLNDVCSNILRKKIKKIFKFVDNSQDKAGAYILRQKIVLVDSFYKRFCIGYGARSAKTCFNKGYIRDIERIYFIKF